MLDINVNVKVPNGDCCEGCRFISSFSFYIKPDCLLFNKELRLKPTNEYKCIKCDECIKKGIESMDDYNDCCEYK